MNGYKRKKEYFLEELVKANLIQLNKRKLRNVFRQMIVLLSVFVVVVVFWCLKLTGITLAGEAFCGMDEHVHADACYEMSEVCSIAEHIHVESCYSNMDADIETSDVWEATLTDVPLDGSTAETIVAVARSQLGYAESLLNFEVDMQGIRRGITRYGQWYGNPYGDWSAMFAMFCLHYAGVDDFPANGGTESLRLEWEASGLYQNAEKVSPQVGNLIFYENTVAIITEVSEKGITVIQGDFDDTVVEHTLSYNDTSILGYGLVPEYSAYAVLTSQSDDTQVRAEEWCTIWLDGTNGNLMSLQGADKSSLTVNLGDTITLPSRWKSPEKYEYTLRGWYDVKNGRYYAAGENVVVNEELLFYADWVASTYDIGQMNEDVVNTVSTSEFFTTHVFDYNSLFNVLSMNNDYSGGDTTRWTLIESGTVRNTGKETLNFIFVDYDDPGNPGAISYPIGRNQANGVDYSLVTSGLYNQELAAILYDRDLDIAGKHYLGTGDYLFQYGSDPADGEHYGYFYYDSMLNAASYHQSNGRFYVYDYLERTVDSASNNSYSDFLPLNSPYANTNGKATGTYMYNGVYNEYVGIPHLSYDSKYSDNDNSPNRIVTNYWFGMHMEMEFYLPSVPGTVDSEGILANQSIVGDDMVFEFSGDDDVWVLIDGKLVLDIGGIHGVENGSIDFSTGDVIVDGVKTGTVTNLSPGSHTLTMYYLERGSSMSNFKLRFNLSTRYSMTLQKEDTLTAQLLNGAQFAVYTDEACTHPAELWSNRDAHERGEPSTHIFTVENGVATMWGFAAGNTYYFEEIRGPNLLDGVPANGIIRMRLNNQGLPDYDIFANKNGDLTVGYTVHGYKINEDTQDAYLVITNTEAVESEPTEVYVEKVWSDNADHSSDSITVYLLANGTRIQSVELNRLNDWKHTWVNLPKTDAGGRDVIYTVREAMVPGYVGKVEEISAVSGGGGSSGGITATNGFTNGQTYLLQTRFGYIGASDNKILLESSQANAQKDNYTQWVATVHSDGRVTLTNKVGQTLYYDNYTFRVSSSPGSYKDLSFSDGKLFCYIDHGGWSETLYPIDDNNVPNNVTYNGVFYTTNTGSQALAITPYVLQANEPVVPSGNGVFYRITNTPAGEATISLQVKKLWDLGSLGDISQYEGLTIEMKLLADGEYSGLNGTFNLRNGWSYTFESLPKYNSSGNEIKYSVEEMNLPEGWHVEYGPVTPINHSETDYETFVTNVYHMTVELPSTGGIGPYGYILLGALIMIGSLSLYKGQTRK